MLLFIVCFCMIYDRNNSKVVAGSKGVEGSRRVEDPGGGYVRGSRGAQGGGWGGGEAI